MPWWDEAVPERLEQEHEALRRAGYSFQTHNEGRADGCLSLMVHARVNGQIVSLHAVFPAHYPYFPPSVYAPHGTLIRHQNPVSGALCLLEDGGDRAWRPRSDTLAALLGEQLPRLVEADAATDRASASSVEQHAPEPITAFLEHEQGSHLTIPFGDLPDERTHGRLKVAVEHFNPLRGAVLEIQDADGRPLLHAGTGIERRQRQRGSTIVDGRWVRLPERPPNNHPGTIKDLGAAVEPSFSRMRWSAFDGSRNKARKLDLRAVCFTDELEWRGTGTNWIVTVDRRDPSKRKFDKSAQAVRVELDGREVAQQRIPALGFLADKTLALFGAGSVGSVVAEVLTQSLVGHLHVVDRDELEAGNAVRWATGRNGAGLAKAEVLGRYLQDNYPFTEIYWDRWPFGVGLFEAATQGRCERTVLNRMLDGAHIIVDTSASTLLNNFLADVARHRQIPYVWGHTTAGAWGGIVGRIVPAQTEGCWVCHQHWLGQEDGLPQPPTDVGAPDVEPVGCAHPTFPGASMDLNEVSLMLARLAVATLSQGTSVSSLDYPWDIAVLSLRDQGGAPCPPSWTTHKLTAHPGCCGGG